MNQSSPCSVCSAEQLLLFPLSGNAQLVTLRVPATVDYKYACWRQGFLEIIHCSHHSKSASYPSSSKPQPPGREWNQRQLISTSPSTITRAERHCPFSRPPVALCDKSDRCRPDSSRTRRISNLRVTETTRAPTTRNDTQPDPLTLAAFLAGRNTNHPLVEFCLSGPGLCSRPCRKDQTASST